MFSFFKQQIITLGLGYLAQIATRIPFAPLRDYVTFLISESRYVVDVLTDTNKDDKEQLKEVWKNARPEFVVRTSNTTAAFADAHIKDTKVKYVTLNLIKDLEYVLSTGEIPKGSHMEGYYKGIDFSKGHIVDGPEDIIL